MAVKLKSISRQIRWSLVLRAFIFALAWLWLPFWIFFLVALYLYFVPLFQVGKLAIPFFLLLFLTYSQPPSIASALMFGAIFYIIFLIKDLLLIDRRSAYELLAFFISFLLLREFYMTFNEGVSGSALFYALMLAAALALLLRSFIRCFEGDATATKPVHRAALWLSFLLLWQIVIAGLFLPLDFVYQSVIVFLVVVLLMDLIPEYLLGAISRKKILTATSAVFVLFVIVLGSARWGL